MPLAVLKGVGEVMTTQPPLPTHEEITRRAFHIWQANGRRIGMANEDWQAAERELERERQHVALNDLQDDQDATD